MTEDVFEALCRRYKEIRATLSQRDLAMREQEIWVLVVTDERRDAWFTDRFGGTQREYRHRLRLLRAGRAAGPLWNRVHAGTLNIDIAADILADARKLDPSGIPEDLGAAVQLALEQYDQKKLEPPSTPRPAHQRHTWNESAREKSRVARRGTRQLKEDAKFLQSPPSAEDALRFRNQIRIAVNSALDEFVNGRKARYQYDDYLLNRTLQEFTEWIESGISTLFNEMRKLQDHGRRTALASIGVTRFTHACEVLNINAEFGAPLDAKAAAKLRRTVRTRHHTRSRELHPDRKSNGGLSEKELAEYNAVQEARVVLEEYISQMEGSVHA